MPSGYGIALNGVSFDAVPTNLSNLSSCVIEDAFYIKLGGTIIIGLTFTVDPIVNGTTPSSFDIEPPFPIDPTVDPFTCITGGIWGGGSATKNGTKLTVTFTGQGIVPEKRFMGIAYRAAA